MGKAYRGERVKGRRKDGKPQGAECRVWVVSEDGKERPLDPQTDLMDHSLTGFDWGHEGPGAAQLAFALAYDMTKDERRALRLHHPLKRVVVSTLAHGGWTFTAEDLGNTIFNLEDRFFNEDYRGHAVEPSEETLRWES